MGQATAAAFTPNPDHPIITSLVRLADSTGAHLRAEIGDNRKRFIDARALKAFAGPAPVAKTSGRRTRITRRHVKNNRLAAAGLSGRSSRPAATDAPAHTAWNVATTATAGFPTPPIDTCT